MIMYKKHIEDIVIIQPITRERLCGGYICVTPEDASVRFAVIGKSRDSALAEFSRAAEIWADALRDDQTNRDQQDLGTARTKTSAPQEK